MPRKGYPSNPVEFIVRRMGLSGALLDRMRTVKVDGSPLMLRDDTARTPHEFDPRVETKYAEAFAAATAACMAGLTDVEIFTTFADGRARETPDLLLHSRNCPAIEVEVVNVDETGATRVHLFRVQAAIAKVLQAHPEWKTSRQVRFTVDYERTKHLTPAHFDALAEEFIGFYEAQVVDYMPRGHFVDLFPPHIVTTYCNTIMEIDQPSYAILVTFTRGDPGIPYEDILRTIERKRRLPYKNKHPLWLIVNISDPRGPFKEALEAAANDAGEIAPFERVIIQDGHFAAQVPPDEQN